MNKTQTVGPVILGHARLAAVDPENGSVTNRQIRFKCREYSMEKSIILLSLEMNL